MSRWFGAAALCLLLTSCGVGDAGVVTGPRAPTGLARGMTLYFLDADGHLVAQHRDTGRLGTLAETLSLLLAGPGGSGAATGIAETDNTRVEVLADEATITLRLPLAETDVTRLGAAQIVCTALASHVQAGGSPVTTVRLGFTIAAPGSDRRRTCPAIR